MKQILTSLLLVASVQFASAQSWNITGNSGTTAGTNFIGTTDAKDFVFKTNNTEKGRVKSNGLWQFGATTNLAKIDSGGNLSFAGNAAYKVAANKYAFQYSANPNYGLFFNSTGLLYEFRTSTALSVFSIGANSGNGIFKGNLKVGAYTLPATDGSSGQVLKTNGAGALTWSADNGTAYSGGTGITFAGSTINSTWTTNGNNIYNNNTQSVGIGGLSTDLSSKLNVINSGGSSGIFVSDPVDGAVLSCTKSGINAGIYINKNYTGFDQTTTAAIEAHVNSNNSAIEGWHSQGAYGALGSYGTGVYGYGGTNGGTGVSGFSIGSGNALTGNASGTGAGMYAVSDSGYGVYGSTNLTTAGYFTTNYASNSAKAIQGIFSATGSYDGVGVYGSAITTSSNFGFGGYFQGNYMGVVGAGNIGGYTGIYAQANNASFAIYCNGNFSGTGTNSYTSDSKLKKNIVPVENALDQLMKLKPSTYQFRVGEFGDMYLPSGNHYGVIAQDLQKVFPDLVSENKFYNNDKSSFDYLAVNYQELTPVLIAAIQEQQKSIEELQATTPENNVPAYEQQIADLNTKLDAMMNKVNALETSLSQCCSNYNNGTGSNSNGSSTFDLAKLEQNIPNPFSQSAYIRFYIPSAARSASLSVTDSNGKAVKTFSNIAVGFGTVNINGGELAAGDYFYTLTIDGNIFDTKKMTLTK